MKTLQPPSALSFRLVLAKITAHRLKHQNVSQRRANCKIRRQVEQFAEPGIPGNEPPLLVEYAQTLANIFESTLQQCGPALQSALFAAQARSCHSQCFSARLTRKAASL